MLIRSDVRMNAAKTVPMIRRGSDDDPPDRRDPVLDRLARRQAVHVLFPDAAHQEDHVVHEEAKRIAKAMGGTNVSIGPVLPRLDVEQVALLEDEREHAEPDESREDGRHGCGQQTTIDRNAIASTMNVTPMM